MTVIPGRRILALGYAGFRKEAKTAFRRVSDQIAGIVRRYANADGSLALSNQDETRLRQEARQAVMRLFVDPYTEAAFASDGVTALAEYPRLLNKYYVYVVAAHVRTHRRWMKAHLPEDVYNWLASVRSKPFTEAKNPYLRQPDEPLEDYLERLDDLRIFRPNPLAKLDPSRQWVPMHNWNTPDGYVLSDRVWRVGDETRRQIDALITQALREGRSAEWIARRVEQFLTPGAAKIRTKTPYGRDGSYSAMRLARTEIARAANFASYTAGYMNPYCTGVDVARSANGDATCPICPQHATIDISQQRVKEPYSYDAAHIPPNHPHCMCRVENVVTDDPAAVTDRLRAVMNDPDVWQIEPGTTPAQVDNFIEQLIGRALMHMLAQVAQLPLI